MKNIILLILFIPFIGFANDSDIQSNHKQIIYIKPTSLILGSLSLSYEREIINQHVLTIGIPFYYKRDVTNLKPLRIIAPSFDEYLYDIDQFSNSTLNEILDDADDLAYLSSIGFNIGYKYYFNNNKFEETLSGFYINPHFSTEKLKCQIEINRSDIDFLLNNHAYPDVFNDWDYSNVNFYELDGSMKVRTISLNFGHQWIRNWFAIDMKFGLSHYNLNYEYDDQVQYDNQNGIVINKFKGVEKIFIPQFKIKLGIAF